VELIKDEGGEAILSGKIVKGRMMEKVIKNHVQTFGNCMCLAYAA